LARLEPQRAAAHQRLASLPTVEAPPPATPPIVLKAIVVLIEALKVAGLWAVSQQRQPTPAQTASSPASLLAQRRWAKVK
jgi:hypothetical protein